MRRRKSNAGADQMPPEIEVGVYISTISSVRSAVEAACLDEGTTFKSMGSFDHDAFYMPLLMVAGQMNAVMWAVDRWAFRAKWMKHIDNELTHIYANETLPYDERFAKIFRRLSKCKPFNLSYCQAFRNVIARLDLLLDAGNALISFISLVCEEGNSLALNHPRYLGAREHENAGDDKEFSTASSHQFQTNFSLFPELGYSSVGTSLPKTPPHPATPTWKLSLANKYASEKLYVGPAELKVFANTLGYARVVHEEITKTLDSVNDLADLADEMLEVFNDWNEKYEMWERYHTPETEVEIWEDVFVG